MYRTQENFGGKKFGEIGKSQVIRQSFFANFHN